MKRSRLPAGTYTARVTKRYTHTGAAGSASVELTFEVTTPPLAGRTVSGGFYDHVRIDRARSLQKNQPVQISVVIRRDQRGRQFAVVKDFRPAGQPTVVTFINGVSTTNPRNPDQPRVVIGPVEVITERKREYIEREQWEWKMECEDIKRDQLKRKRRGEEIDIDQWELLDRIEPRQIPLLDPEVFDSINDFITVQTDSCNILSQAVDKPPFADVHCLSMLVVGGEAGKRALHVTDEVFARYARADG